jgi:hypothetical protein
MDKSLRPQNQIEHYLWSIGRAGLQTDIEMARLVAQQLNVKADRIELFLGSQIICIDPLFLKEKKLLNLPNGMLKKVRLAFSKRTFSSKAMKNLLDLAGYSNLVKK